MTRGTTTDLIFEFPFDASEVTALSVVIEQAGVIVIKKTLEDCKISGNEVSVPLSEEDTLSFLPGRETARIQVRCGIDDVRLATNIWTIAVEQILEEGKLVENKV